MWQDKRVSRCYGRSLVGERTVVKKVKMQNWGSRATAIPILCTEGMVELGLYEGNVNVATFQDFVTEKLCPNILPFNGVNTRSIVILGKKRWVTGKPCVSEKVFVSSLFSTNVKFSPFRDEDFPHHSNGCQLQRHSFKVNLPLEKLMLYFFLMLHC